MFFNEIKDEKLKDSLYKVYDIRKYEFLYLNNIYPITEQKIDENGIYFEYLKTEMLLDILKEIDKVGDS